MSRTRGRLADRNGNGLITSTALSLVFVPAIFSLIDGLKTRLERLLDRAFHQQHATPEETPAE